MIVIRKFAYLKTPLWSWTITNEQGGSFSNSGMLRSERACIRHALAQIRRYDGGKCLANVYSVDGDGNEQLTATLDLQEVK